MAATLLFISQFVDQNHTGFQIDPYQYELSFTKNGDFAYRKIDGIKPKEFPVEKKNVKVQQKKKVQLKIWCTIQNISESIS